MTPDNAARATTGSELMSSGVQPASTARAQPAVRAMIEICLCLTSSSGEYRSDRYVAKGDNAWGGTRLVPQERHDSVPRLLGKGLRKPLPNTVRTGLR